jgi:hypothetical protein
LTRKQLILLLACSISTSTATASETGGEWLGSYLNQSKAGWSFLSISPPDSSPTLSPSEMERLGPQGQDHPFLLVSEARMGVMAYGKRKQLAWKTLAYLNADYSLSRFVFHMDGDGASSDFLGQVNGNLLELTILSSGDSRQEKIPLAGSQVFLAETLARQAAETLSRGGTVDGEYQVVEPHQVSVSKWKMRFEENEDLQIGDQRFETYRIMEDTGGFTTQTWVTPTGRVVKEWAPLADGVGYLSLAESESQAKDLEYSNPGLTKALPASSSNEPDLMYSTSVDGGMKIPFPTQVKRMVIELSNFTLRHPFPFSKFQRNLGKESESYPSEAPLQLEVLKATTTPEIQVAETNPLPAHLARYLQPEPLVQSDHPEIVERAKAIVGEAKGNWGRALTLQAWMLHTFNPSSGSHSPPQLKSSIPARGTAMSSPRSSRPWHAQRGYPQGSARDWSTSGELFITMPGMRSLSRSNRNNGFPSIPYSNKHYPMPLISSLERVAFPSRLTLPG